MSRKRNKTTTNSPSVRTKPTNDRRSPDSKEKEAYDKTTPEPNKAPEEAPSKSEPSYTARTANDPEWYANDPQLMFDSANLPYSYPLGDEMQYADVALDLTDGTDHKKLALNQCNALPGLCTLRIKGSIGYNHDRTDPANVAANAFYTHVRYVNAGRKNYDPSDLMIYAIAIADLYSFIFFCERIYGYAFTFSQRNKYIGDALIASNQVDPDSVRANLANFRYWLNAFINKVSSYVVPNNISYFKRRAFMYSGLYIENNDANLKDQLYQFAPAGFYKFKLDSRNIGMLEFKPFGNGSNYWDENALYSVYGLIQYGEDLMQNMYGDEDFGLMSGDILKAYGSDLIGLGTMPEEYYVLPVYDEYVLSQFKNATICGLHFGNNKIQIHDLGDTTNVFGTGDIVQSKYGDLLCCEELQHTWASGLDNMVVPAIKKVLSTVSPQPGPAETMEATRLMVAYSDVLTEFGYEADQPSTSDKYQGSPYKIMSGSEIVVEMLITKASWISGNWKIATAIQSKRNGITIDTATLYSTGMQPSIDSLAFKYAPILYSVGRTVNGNNITIDTIHPLSNIDNFTLVGSTELGKMHECALLSLFFVPGVAKLVNFMK